MKSYKIEINPNNKQLTLLHKSCGVARFAYNWGLNFRKHLYETEQKTITSIGLHKELNKLKKTDYPWMYEVSKCAPQEALRDLDNAYNKFFKTKKGYPKFKKKDSKQSFRINYPISITGNYIKLPRIGKIRLKESNYLPLDKHILSVTVSKISKHWFVSITTNEEILIPENNSNEIIGLDLGIKTLITCSDGTKIENPKALNNKLRKLKKLNRRLSKKKKGSRNRVKCKDKLAELHYKVSNIRKDVTHKVTSALVKAKPKTLVIEDLNVSGMTKNHKLARHINDSNFGEIRRQLEYKCKMNNIELYIVDRFFPSSKLCSCCGFMNNELKLSNRSWECPCCGQIHDRDLNAAKNLKQYYIKQTTVSSTGCNVCGDEGSGKRRKSFAKPSSVKQKENSNIMCNIT